ncbi:MAG: hypothetical protein V7734_03920 [Maribacter arcticus]|uniref:hypothetical protein n=1 Tax=Maribacter arcticus TaxID=561365 RepID=UPI003001A9DE
MNKAIIIKLFLIITCLQLLSCNNSNIDNAIIKGNWQLNYVDNKQRNYQEIYIDSATTYYYDYYLGLRPVGKYYVVGNKFYELILGREFKFIGKINVENDILYVEDNNFEVSFKKIDGFNNLENLIKGKIEKDKYWASYIKRYESWKNKP